LHGPGLNGVGRAHPSYVAWRTSDKQYEGHHGEAYASMAHRYRRICIHVLIPFPTIDGVAAELIGAKVIGGLVRQPTGQRRVRYADFLASGITARSLISSITRVAAN